MYTNIDCLTKCYGQSTLIYLIIITCVSIFAQKWSQEITACSSFAATCPSLLNAIYCIIAYSTNNFNTLLHAHSAFIKRALRARAGRQLPGVCNVFVPQYLTLLRAGAHRTRPRTRTVLSRVYTCVACTALPVIGKSRARTMCSHVCCIPVYVEAYYGIGSGSVVAPHIQYAHPRVHAIVGTQSTVQIANAVQPKMHGCNRFAYARRCICDYNSSETRIAHDDDATTTHTQQHTPHTHTKNIPARALQRAHHRRRSHSVFKAPAVPHAQMSWLCCCSVSPTLSGAARSRL